MRYIRWIIILVCLLFLIVEVGYNFQTTTQTFAFAIWVPGKTLATVQMEIWIGLLVTFGLGFGLAIFFELYYWSKYALTIHKQNQTIKSLKQELDELKARDAQRPDPGPGSTAP